MDLQCHDVARFAGYREPTCMPVTGLESIDNSPLEEVLTLSAENLLAQIKLDVVKENNGHLGGRF